MNRPEDPGNGFAVARPMGASGLAFALSRIHRRSGPLAIKGGDLAIFCNFQISRNPTRSLAATGLARARFDKSTKR